MEATILDTFSAILMRPEGKQLPCCALLGDLRHWKSWRDSSIIIGFTKKEYMKTIMIWSAADTFSGEPRQNPPWIHIMPGSRIVSKHPGFRKVAFAILANTMRTLLCKLFHASDGISSYSFETSHLLYQLQLRGSDFVIPLHTNQNSGPVSIA